MHGPCDRIGTCPRRADARLVHLYRVPARASVLHRQRGFLVGNHNKDGSQEAYLVQELLFLVDLKLVVLGNDIVEKEVVVHGEG